MKTLSALTILFSFAGLLNAQDRTISAVVPPGRKIYVEKTFTQMEVVNRQNNMRFMQQRNLTIRVTGPEKIQQGRRQRFELEIIPEGGLSIDPNRTEYVINDFSAYFVSTTGFVDFVDQPVYEAIVDKQKHKIHDISTEARHRSLAAGAFLLVISQSIGPQSLFMGIVGLAGKALDWATNRELDYLGDWQRVNTHDYFAVPYPAGSEPGRDYSWLQVTCPFVRNEPTGSLSLHIEYISIRPRQKRSGSELISDYFLTDLDFELVSEGQPRPVSRINLGSSFQSDKIKIKNTYGAETGITAAIKSSAGQNNLKLRILPDKNMYSGHQYQNIQLALVVPRSTMRITGMPTVSNQKNDRYELISQKSQRWDDFFRSFLLTTISLLGKGSCQADLNLMGQSIAAGYQVISNIEALFSNNYLRYSFSQITRMQWENQREIDYFQLPLFGRRMLYNENFTEELVIQISLEFYANEVPEIVIIGSADIHVIRKGSMRPVKQKDFFLGSLSFREVDNIVELNFLFIPEKKFILNTSPENRISEKKNSRLLLLNLLLIYMWMIIGGELPMNIQVQ